MPDTYWLPPEDEDRLLSEASARRASYARTIETMTPEQLTQAQRLTRENSNLSAGLLQALAQAQVPREIEQALIEQDEGNWFDGLRDGAGDIVGDIVGATADVAHGAVQQTYERAIKPALRGLVLVADGLAQEVVQRPLTTIGATITEGGNPLDHYGDYGDSALINLATGDLAADDPENPQGILGRGLFPGGQAMEESRAERILQINGRKADVGQAFAGVTVGTFANPGDRLYDAVAGVSGFAIDVGLDPLAWATGGATAALKARKVLNAGEAADVLRYADDVSTTPASRSVVRRSVDRVERSYSASDSGRLLRQRDGGVGSLYSMRPSEITDRVFREVGGDDAAAFLPGTNVFSDSRRVTYFANTRNLARGQGDNRGVLFEFDTSKLDEVETRVNTRKPGWEPVYDAGEAELTMLTSPNQLSNAVQSVTIHSGVSGSKGSQVNLQRLLDRLVDKEGWQKVDVEDGVRYIRPTETTVVDEIDEVLEVAGAINGARRNTVLVERASDFFRDERLLGKLAEADAFTIAKSWGKSPANRLDMETIGRLGAASDQSQVAEILLEAVANGDVTQRGLLRGPGHFVRSTALKTPLKFVAGDGKLSGIAPKGVVSAGSVEEIGEAAFKVDSLLRQANVGQDVRRLIFNDMATLEPGDFSGLFDITTDALEEIAIRVGPEAATLRNVAQKYAEDLEAFRKFGVDSWGDAIDVPYAARKFVQNFDGTKVETILPTPQMTSELNALALHLPDPQDIRRAATKNSLLRSVYTSKGWDGLEGATRKLTGDIFKPLALLRPAYILRIGAEEQARLTAAGYDSVMNHPFRWLQANVRSRGAIQDLTGDSLEDVARATDIITKDAHGVLADKAASQARVFGVTSVKVDDAGNLAADSYRGWKGELGQISAAPEGRKMAELRGNLGEFKQWAQTEGRESIEKLSRVNDEAASLLDFGSDFDAWAASLARRVQIKTGGQVDEAGQLIGGFDEDIIGRIVSRDIPWANAHGQQAKNADAAFHSFLSGKARAGIHPGKVKIENVASPARMKMMDTAVDWLFDHITGKPTSYLARFPAFRQSMVRRGTELMDALDSDATRRSVLEAFEKNMGLTNDEFRKLAQAAQDAAGSKGVIDNVSDFNEVLVGKAASDAKDLLFDVTKRGATQDAMVAIMPFLDAWKEVTLTWSRLVKENPAFFIRAQAGHRELQDQGTFYTNEYGQEVFRYPGGGFLSTFVDEMNQRGGGLTNAPMAAIETVGRVATGDTPDFSVAAEGPVQGLNMLATGVGPGFGPVIQWGASVLDGPDTRRLREFIAPFGTGAVDDPEDMLNFGGVIGGLMPAWMRKTVNSFTEGDIDERQYNSMFGDSMRALVASGEYDPADTERLMEDAKRYTDYQLLFRGFVQATGPTGPTLAGQVELDEADLEHPDWNPENDPTGRMFFLGVMRSDYFDLYNKHGSFDVAAEKFYEMYGIEPFYVTQAKSTTGGRELPVTREGDDWMSAHGEAVDKFPLVAGFWAPTDEGAKFDFSAFADQVNRGDRESLSPEDQVALANKARARAMYESVKAQTEILPAQLRDQARATATAQLENLHPGWRMDVIVQPSKDDKIAQLKRAAFDDSLNGQPLTQPLRDYLALRDQALERVRLRSGSPTATLGREDATLERRMLMTAGVRLQQQHPTFRGVWSALLKSELEEA